MKNILSILRGDRFEKDRCLVPLSDNKAQEHLSASEKIRLAEYEQEEFKKAYGGGPCFGRQ
jgi:hypothetical protein